MTKRLFLAAAFVVITLSLFLSPAFAAYSWVDDNGVFHITDYPKPVKREEPQKNTPEPEVTAPRAIPEVKQVPVQAAPVAPTPPQGQLTPVAATVQTSTNTTTTRPLVPAAAGMPLSAGAPTIKPAGPVSQLTQTPGGHDSVSTAATISQLTTTALPAMQEQPRTALPIPQAPPQLPAAGIMAFVMAFFMVFLLLIAGIYVYFSLCLYLIAKKLNVQAPWTAWIPIVNIWTLLQAAGKPCWWVLLFFIPFVSIFVVAYVWMCIVENLGRNKWLGILMLIPIVNLVYIGVLAFSKEEQHDDPHGQAESIGQEWQPTPDTV